MILLGLLPAAVAEGAADFGGSFFLLNDTVMVAEARDGEGLSWRGTDDLRVLDEDGNLISALANGGWISLSEGQYTLMPVADQYGDWDVSVTDSSNGTKHSGRIFSTSWVLTTEYSYLKGAFYAAVETDSGTTIVDVTVDNLVGAPMTLRAGRQGIAEHPTQSTPLSSGDPDAEYPLYLNPPDTALSSAQLPTGSDLSIQAEDDAVVFRFTADSSGAHAVSCDISGDGAFDLSGADDWLHYGLHDPGQIEVKWEDPIQTQCQVWLLSGPVHVLIANASTAYPGVALRVYPGRDEPLEPMTMLWNDSLIADDALLYRGEETLDSPEDPSGLEAAGDGESTYANLNCRAWGDFTGESRGVGSWMSTWSAVDAVLLSTADVTLDPSADTAAAVDTAVDTAGPDGRTLTGRFQGGACRCSAAALPGLPLWLVVLYSIRRRQLSGG